MIEVIVSRVEGYAAPFQRICSAGSHRAVMPRAPENGAEPRKHFSAERL